jgi:hypothetical protein
MDDFDGWSCIANYLKWLVLIAFARLFDQIAHPSLHDNARLGMVVVMDCAVHRRC